MTREEQIGEAYQDYLGLGGARYSIPWLAFKAGVEWADEHPNIKSIWHDATKEEPHCEYEIIVLNKFGITKLIDFKYVDLYYNCSWTDYIIEGDIVSWAYIKDLLPKGGEK